MPTPEPVARPAGRGIEDIRPVRGESERGVDALLGEPEYLSALSHKAEPTPPARRRYRRATVRIRGGQVTFGQPGVTPDLVRFVRDLRVSGPIKLTPDGRATASLRAEIGERTHEVTLAWTPFSTHPSLSGAFDGIPFP